MIFWGQQLIQNRYLLKRPVQTIFGVDSYTNRYLKVYPQIQVLILHWLDVMHRDTNQ
jgi:hypothetical protein